MTKRLYASKWDYTYFTASTALKWKYNMDGETLHKPHVLEPQIDRDIDTLFRWNHPWWERKGTLWEGHNVSQKDIDKRLRTLDGIKTRNFCSCSAVSLETRFPFVSVARHTPRTTMTTKRMLANEFFMFNYFWREKRLWKILFDGQTPRKWTFPWLRSRHVVGRMPGSGARPPRL
jgi:hypothetical protein